MNKNIARHPGLTLTTRPETVFNLLAAFTVIGLLTPKITEGPPPVWLQVAVALSLLIGMGIVGYIAIITLKAMALWLSPVSNDDSTHPSLISLPRAWAYLGIFFAAGLAIRYPLIPSTDEGNLNWAEALFDSGFSLAIYALLTLGAGSLLLKSIAPISQAARNLSQGRWRFWDTRIPPHPQSDDDN